MNRDRFANHSPGSEGWRQGGIQGDAIWRGYTQGYGAGAWKAKGL
jgi:hypothetical protein